MTPKEYLQQARGMQSRLESLQDRRRRYEDLATNATARYRSGPGGGTRRVSSVEEYGTKLADLSREMQLRADLYADCLRQIEAAIDAVEPAVYRDVLKYRYLNGWSWNQVANRLNYTPDHVWHLHGAALRAVRVPANVEPVEQIIRRKLRICEKENRK